MCDYQKMHFTSYIHWLSKILDTQNILSKSQFYFICLLRSVETKTQSFIFDIIFETIYFLSKLIKWRILSQTSTEGSGKNEKF